MGTIVASARGGRNTVNLPAVGPGESPGSREGGRSQGRGEPLRPPHLPIGRPFHHDTWSRRYPSRQRHHLRADLGNAVAARAGRHHPQDAAPFGDAHRSSVVSGDAGGLQRSQHKPPDAAPRDPEGPVSKTPGRCGRAERCSRAGRYHPLVAAPFGDALRRSVVPDTRLQPANIGRAARRRQPRKARPRELRDAVAARAGRYHPHIASLSRRQDRSPV